MNAKTTAVIAVIALVLTAGAATAMPGSAPDHAADGENAPDDASADAANASAADAADRGPAANASSHAATGAANAAAADAANDSARNAENARGPAVDLPAQVPDHVAQIHDAIASFLSGDGEGSLGETISGIVGGDDPAPAENATNQSDGA